MRRDYESAAGRRGAGALGLASLCLLLLAPLPAAAQDMPFPLDPDGMNFYSCYRKARSGNCYHGSGLEAGCVGSCAMALFQPCTDAARAFAATVTGQVVDPGGRPLGGVQVDMILSDCTFYSVRPGEGGRFRIPLPADSRYEDPPQIEHDYGQLTAEPGTRRILLVGGLSEELLEMHPKLSVREMTVEQAERVLQERQR